MFPQRKQAVNLSNGVGFDTKTGFNFGAFNKNAQSSSSNASQVNNAPTNGSNLPIKAKNPKIDKSLVCCIALLDEYVAGNLCMNQIRAIHFRQNGCTNSIPSNPSPMNSQNQQPVNNNGPNNGQIQNTNNSNPWFSNSSTNSSFMSSQPQNKQNFNNNTGNSVNSSQFSFGQNSAIGQNSSFGLGGGNSFVQEQNKVPSFGTGLNSFNFNQSAPSNPSNPSSNFSPANNSSGFGFNFSLNSNQSNNNSFLNFNQPKTNPSNSSQPFSFTNNNTSNQNSSFMFNQNSNLNNTSPQSGFNSFNSFTNTQNNPSTNNSTFEQIRSAPSLFGMSNAGNTPWYVQMQKQEKQLSAINLNIQKSILQIKNSQKINKYINGEDWNSDYNQKSNDSNNISDDYSFIKQVPTKRMDMFDQKPQIQLFSKKQEQQTENKVQTPLQREQRQYYQKMRSFRSKVKEQFGTNSKRNNINQQGNFQINNGLPVRCLPLQGRYTLLPNYQILSNMSIYDLSNVDSVQIYGEFGQVKFKSPISLQNKNIEDCVSIRQNQIEILDSDWLKNKFCQLTYYNFGHYIEKTQEQKNLIIQKIERWVTKNQMKIIQFNQQTGNLTVQVLLTN